MQLHQNRPAHCTSMGCSLSATAPKLHWKLHHGRCRLSASAPKLHCKLHHDRCSLSATTLQLHHTLHQWWCTLWCTFRCTLLVVVVAVIYSTLMVQFQAPLLIYVVQFGVQFQCNCTETAPWSCWVQSNFLNCDMGCESKLPLA
eukprot:2903041-Alexandrium_andersonii.AAC.1